VSAGRRAAWRSATGSRNRLHGIRWRRKSHSLRRHHRRRHGRKHNADILAQTAREEAQLVGTLERIGASLAAQFDTKRIVQTVTDEATQLTGAQFGAFFYNVLNERGESYTLYALSGVPREAFANFQMPRNTAIFAATFHGEGVMRSDDITADPRYGKNSPYSTSPRDTCPSSAISPFPFDHTMVKSSAASSSDMPTPALHRAT
jgi:hypothetical protein